MKAVFLICNFLSFLSAFCLFQLTEVEVAEAFSLFYPGSRTNDIYTHASVGRPSGLFSIADPHDGGKVEDLNDWSDERKAEIFQFLLRDLEVEGAPLLGCEGVSENKTLQGATWSVAGQLSENDYERKVCLVFEDIPVDNLKLFVDSFSAIKKQQHLMDPLHDLRRFSMSLVGNGIGPALILETENRTKTEVAEYNAMKENTLIPNEIQWKAAMELFVKRCVPELENDPIAYRFLGSSDVCDILSGYWNCICELETTDTTQANSIVLAYPPSSEKETYTRFAALSELINTMNSLYEGEYKYSLAHFHPFYDRDDIIPKDEQVHGHLSPTSLLRERIIQIGDLEAAETFTDEQLTLQNYQRRSPLPGFIIKRTLKETEDSQLDCENVVRIIKEGEEKLKEALTKEMNLISESN